MRAKELRTFWKRGKEFMDKVLTIVVPSYNVESTLRQTVDSMIVPDEQLRELLDILIVNDGSKDGTLAVANKLAQEYPSIVRVWNKENGGHGSTINVGIEQGYGKYMKVVDGDDWLETKALEEYVKVLCETNADVVATDSYHYFMTQQKRQPVKTSVLPYGKLLHFSNAYKDYTFFMYSLAVKTELLRNQSHRIDEHCYYVDVEFDTLAAMVAETILYVDMKLYVYRLQSAGQSVSVEGWMKHYPEHERVALTLIEWYREFVSANGAQKEKAAYLEGRIIRSAGGHYSIGLDFPAQARKAFLIHIKEYDAKLKEQGAAVYQLVAKRPVVRCMRAFHFSEAVYCCIAWLRKMKISISKAKQA